MQINNLKKILLTGLLLAVFYIILKAYFALIFLIRLNIKVFLIQDICNYHFFLIIIFHIIFQKEVLNCIANILKHPMKIYQFKILYIFKNAFKEQ